MSDHPLYAAAYDRLMAPAEAGPFGEQRRLLAARARGRVLDVGAGTGLNLAHYGQASAVTALEPDGAMRRRLAPRVGECPAPVTVVDQGIDEAELAEAGFDTVVCTLVLCTVPRLEDTLSRLRALLAPGGQLLFLEHTAAPGGWGIAQMLADPLWSRLVPGCHLHRDPVTALRRGGFTVSDYERLALTLVPGLIGSLVVGTARVRTLEPPVPTGTFPRKKERGLAALAARSRA